MIGEAIVAEAFKLGLTEVVQYLKIKSSNFKNLGSINIEQAYIKAANIENVKTIWQVDKSVNLNNFYYPSNINIEGKSVCVTSLNIFPENGKIVIQGTAGQGKSILLRYLAGVALKKSQTIPLFIELRKITDRASLPNLICESLSELGISTTEKELDLVLSSNKFSLLLDAFDEVPESNLNITISHIEHLCAKHYRQQILVTSRPGAEIQKVNMFSVFNLEQLDESDFKPMLLKFFNNDDVTVHQIMKSLHENNNEIVNLVTTPLLLTLLAITYKTFNKIPMQLHEFYENIFHVLVNRHDSTKPGFRREYKSKLNERELEDLFCAFCFYSMIEDKTSLSRQEALKISKKSIDFTGIEPASEFSFLSDCIKNTCLLLEEGFNYHFIHKSIREYHSAKFISTSPDELKEKFYRINQDNVYKYRVELEFLRVIDEHCFKKYLLLPMYEKIFLDIGALEKPEKVDIKKQLTGSKMRWNTKGKFVESFFFSDRPLFRFDYMNTVYSKLLGLILKVINNIDRNHNETEICMVNAIIETGYEDEANKILNDELSIMFDTYIEMKSRFSKKENIIADLSF